MLEGREYFWWKDDVEWYAAALYCFLFEYVRPWLEHFVLSEVFKCSESINGYQDICALRSPHVSEALSSLQI